MPIKEMDYFMNTEGFQLYQDKEAIFHYIIGILKIHYTTHVQYNILNNKSNLHNKTQISKIHQIHIVGSTSDTTFIILGSVHSHNGVETNNSTNILSVLPILGPDKATTPPPLQVTLCCRWGQYTQAVSEKRSHICDRWGQNEIQ